MIKSLLAAAALAVGLAGASVSAEAKTMKHHHKMSAPMCYHTVKGKKHWHHCHPKMHHHMKKMMKK